MLLCLLGCIAHRCQNLRRVCIKPEVVMERNLGGLHELFPPLAHQTLGEEVDRE